MDRGGSQDVPLLFLFHLSFVRDLENICPQEQGKSSASEYRTSKGGCDGPSVLFESWSSMGGIYLVTGHGTSSTPACITVSWSAARTWGSYWSPAAQWRVLGPEILAPLAGGMILMPMAQVAPLALTSLPAAALFLPPHSDPSENISGAGW